jgi:hypothetical protein
VCLSRCARGRERSRCARAGARDVLGGPGCCDTGRNCAITGSMRNSARRTNWILSCH